MRIYPKCSQADGLASIKDTLDKARIKAIVSEELQAYFVMLDELAENQSILDAMPRYLLSVIDHYWLEHIEAMERLKEGIGLRGYSQEDPMRQYGREGYELFTDMYHQIEKGIGQQAALIQSSQNQYKTKGRKMKC